MVSEAQILINILKIVTAIHYKINVKMLNFKMVIIIRKEPTLTTLEVDHQKNCDKKGLMRPKPSLPKEVLAVNVCWERGHHFFH